MCGFKDYYRNYNSIKMTDWKSNVLNHNPAVFIDYPHEKINRCLTNINRCLTDIFKI